MSHLRDLRVLAFSVLILAGVLISTAPGPALGELVELKTGIVYRGTMDRSNTIVWIFDGLKRVTIRDSKIRRIDADSTFGRWEIFKLHQPLIQHAGNMPKEAVVIKTSPWNDRGRR